MQNRIDDELFVTTQLGGLSVDANVGTFEPIDIIMDDVERSMCDGIGNDDSYMDVEDVDMAKSEETIENMQEEFIDDNRPDGKFQGSKRPESENAFQDESKGPGADKIREHSGKDQYVIHNHFYQNIFGYPEKRVRGQIKMPLSLDWQGQGQEQEQAEQEQAEEEQENEQFQFYNFEQDYTTEPNNVIIMLNLMKSSINYTCCLIIMFFIFRNFSSDLQQEYERLLHFHSLKVDQCQREYWINKCDDPHYAQLPALKDQCLEWSICFSDEFLSESGVNYTELGVKLIGRLINEFLETIDNMNKLILLAFILVWYLGNALVEYYKRKIPDRQKIKSENTDTHNIAHRKQYELIKLE
ncbi:hypothetical protein DAMA08_000440 [Martiniozyma asiatica (nom. inval.)]|nr:hypothetical protein DAMA08_000440 [Martiniozyma asiatica]